MNKWRPIFSAPYDETRVMFVVRAIDAQLPNGCIYTTDPYCVWRTDDGGFARWPHSFPPTHWLPLPGITGQE